MRQAILVMAFCTAGAAAAGAGSLSWQEDFTFRRVAVAPQTGGSRINVQIDPEEQARRLAARPVPDAAPATPSEATAPSAGAGVARYGWFWERVAADLAGSTGRYAQTVAALADPPEGGHVAAPRLQELQDLAARHGADVLRATVGTAVSPALVLAVIAVESAGAQHAVSSAGAQGLMQLVPETAARFGVEDVFDAGQNIRGGVAYLDWLMGHFDRDPVLVLAAYNAGEGAVRRNGGVPPFAETRDYVPKVLAAWMVARGLCATVPELPSDGCVFRVMQAG